MTNYNLFSEALMMNGMDRNRAVYLAHLLEEDEKTSGADKEAIKWSMERGFLPGRISLYDLTEENYKDYLPDYGFFKIFPLNGWQKIWVNDKLTLKYALNTEQFKDVMPKYYIYVENDGSYSYLMDMPEDQDRDENVLFHLLEKEKVLAIKPNNGSGGHGFIRLEIDAGGGGYALKWKKRRKRQSI